MTKKDFELIAEVLREAVEEAEGNLNQEATLESLVIDFTNILSMKNPRFDRDKFFIACGIK